MQTIILLNYEKLTTANWAAVQNDAKWVMYDLTNLIHAAFAEDPKLLDITFCKAYGLSNAEVRDKLLSRHGETYSIEYISYLYIIVKIVQMININICMILFIRKSDGFTVKCIGLNSSYFSITIISKC